MVFRPLYAVGGQELGYLPGSETEKMNPWAQAVFDTLGAVTTQEVVEEVVERGMLEVLPLTHIRGRSLHDSFVIVDEAQNLTPKQMKTLITRAGPGTKVVCLGNISQIDTPYLTEGSSGLTYAVDRFKGWPHGGHVMLARGERSRLADFASEVL